MNATDLLTTLAELGVALAGFSGIVVVVGARPAGVWSAREQVALSVLLAASGGVIVWSIVPLLLLTAEVPGRSVWLFSSGSWFVGDIATTVVRIRQFARQPEAMAQGWGFNILSLLGETAALAVQLANLWLGVAWPHLAAVSWHLALSFLVFVRLLRTPPS
jgi:hypothetical protein